VFRGNEKSGDYRQQKHVFDKSLGIGYRKSIAKTTAIAYRTGNCNIQSKRSKKQHKEQTCERTQSETDIKHNVQSDNEFGNAHANRTQKRERFENLEKSAEHIQIFLNFIRKSQRVDEFYETRKNEHTSENQTKHEQQNVHNRI